MRLKGKRFGLLFFTAAWICVQTSVFSIAYGQTGTTASSADVRTDRESVAKRQDFDKNVKSGFGYLKTSDWELAQSAFDAALEIEPKDGLSLYGKSLAQFNLKQTSAAEITLDTAIRTISSSKEKIYLLADSLVLSAVISAVQNNTSLAIEKLEKAIALVPAHFDANLSLGRAYFGSGRIDESVTAFRRATSIQPDHIKARFFLATALEQQGRSADALKEYRTILNKAPNNVEGNLGLGVLLLKIDGDSSAAGLNALRRAVTLNDRLYEGQIILGKTLVRLNRTTEAIEHLKTAVNLAPSNPEPHFQLAIAYRKLGRKTEADSETEIVKKIHESRRGVSKI